jgi:hypothetical protein
LSRFGGKNGAGEGSKQAAAAATGTAFIEFQAAEKRNN